MPSNVTLAFDAKALKRLNALKKKTEATSYAEVVRNALRLYDALVDETQVKERQFLVREPDGTLRPLNLFH